MTYEELKKASDVGTLYSTIYHCLQLEGHTAPGYVVELSRNYVVVEHLDNGMTMEYNFDQLFSAEIPYALDLESQYG